MTSAPAHTKDVLVNNYSALKKFADDINELHQEVIQLRRVDQLSLAQIRTLAAHIEELTQKASDNVESNDVRVQESVKLAVQIVRHFSVEPPADARLTDLLQVILSRVAAMPTGPAQTPIDVPMDQRTGSDEDYEAASFLATNVIAKYVPVNAKSGIVLVHAIAAWIRDERVKKNGEHRTDELRRTGQL